MWSVLVPDLREAIRSLMAHKAVSSVLVATVLLAVGMTTATASVAYRLLVAPLPFADPGRLVRISEERSGAANALGAPLMASATFNAWIRNPRTLDGLAAFAVRPYVMKSGAMALAVKGAAVSPTFFRVLGVTADAGRLLSETDNAGVVISERLAHRLAGAEPVVGRPLQVDGRPYTVVGVVGDRYAFPDPDVSCWIPLALPPGARTLVSAVGRLRAGSSPQQASTEGLAVARAAVTPGSPAAMFPVVAMHVVPLRDDLTATIRTPLIVLTAGVLIVLIAGSTSVANLLLAGGIARERELAVRASLGATPRRLTSQLLVQHAMLAVIGAAVGAACAWALLRALPLFAPASLARLNQIPFDLITFVGTAAITTAVLLVFGLWPAARASRTPLADSLRGGAAWTSGHGTRRMRFVRASIIGAEAALAVSLIILACVLGRSFLKLTAVDPGYDPDHVLSARFYVPTSEIAERRNTLELSELMDRLKASRGVIAAGGGNMMPFSATHFVSAFDLPDAITGGKPTTVRALEYWVTPGYMEALRMRVTQGRFFDENDARSPDIVAIVNEEFARLHLRSGTVAGIQLADGIGSVGQPVEIVGVVRNVLKDGLDRTPQAEVYLLLPQMRRAVQREMYIVVRTTGDAAAFAPTLRALATQVAPNAALDQVTPLERVLSDSVAEPRFATMVVAAFALLTLLVTSVGLFCVLMYTVSQSEYAMAVRVVMGATSRDLFGLVMAQGLVPSAAGIVAGIVFAAGVAHLVRGALVGVVTLDVPSMLAGPVILLPIALVACIAPALRASRISIAPLLRPQ